MDELLEMDGDGVSLSEFRSRPTSLGPEFRKFSNGLLSDAISMSDAILCPVSGDPERDFRSWAMYCEKEAVGIEVEYVLRDGEARLLVGDHSSMESSSVIEARLDLAIRPMGFGDEGVDPCSEWAPASIQDVLRDRTRYFPPLPPAPDPPPSPLPPADPSLLVKDPWSQSLRLFETEVARLEGLRLELPALG